MELLPTEGQYVVFSERGEHCDDNKSCLATRISLGLDGKNECGEFIFLLLNLVEVSDGTQGVIEGRARDVKGRGP
jgi:hypothetical protein